MDNEPPPIFLTNTMCKDLSQKQKQKHSYYRYKGACKGGILSEGMA